MQEKIEAKEISESDNKIHEVEFIPRYRPPVYNNTPAQVTKAKKMRDTAQTDGGNTNLQFYP